MKIPDDLLELRALALTVASQTLQVRRFIIDVLGKESSISLRDCQKLLPEVNWEPLQQKAAQKFINWQQHEMQTVCYFEAAYPSTLKNIEDPPLILFSKGRALTELAQKCCLAIVGSRRADSDGLLLTQQIARELGDCGIVIISGLALGIDGAAHTGSLQSKSEFPTIAVLGSGVDIIYPPHHQSLAQQILSCGGIILSQFEPDVPPYPANFLNRNRIVSGLSNAVLVIEATLKSGSLVTARHALEQGKDVYVIPGDIYNPRFEGSNRLIQQGANLVTGVQDILEALKLDEIKGSEYQSSSKNGSGFALASKIEKQIVEKLENRNEIRVDELVRELGSISFERELLSLELQGIIQRMPGNVLRLKRK